MQILKLQKALNDANMQLEARVEESTHELKNALDRLAELNQLKSNFISNISHELRTPLTHIKGYLDLLADGGLGPLTQSQQEAVTVLLRAEGRLEGLIEDLIQFSLASRGQLSLNLEVTQIDKIIQIMINRSKPKAHQAEVQLQSKVAERLPLVQIDEDKIGWVLLQLLDNAIKFTPKGGKVQVRAEADNGLITVAIIDTGIGISEDKIDEIFEPFHQLDGSTTRRFAGTGLGLNMVRKILEAHGSSIKVRSVMDRGSIFEFNLPQVREVDHDSGENGQ
jgi:signal transduction histidine kinase